MSYWYSYETNVSKHAISSVKEDDILNIHLPFTVIIELQRDASETIKWAWLSEDVFLVAQLTVPNRIVLLHLYDLMVL